MKTPKLANEDPKETQRESIRQTLSHLNDDITLQSLVLGFHSQRIGQDVLLNPLLSERANNSYLHSQRIKPDVLLSRLPCGRFNKNAHSLL